MHVGSRWGLLPEKYFNADTNPFQRWVITCWKDMVMNIHGTISSIFTLGDLTDGSNMKSLGVDVTSTDLDDQVKWVCELLSPLVGKKTRVYGVDGSGYHSGLATNTDRRVVEHFKGRYAKNTLHIQIHDKLIQLNHESGASNLQKEADRVLQYAQTSHSLAPDLVLRGHVHRYLRYENSTISAISCPGWQYPTPFIEKRSANTKWDIGLLIVEFDKDIIKAYPKTYNIPSDVIEEMRGYTKIIPSKKPGYSMALSQEWLTTCKERRW
jgi:predicted phosphodiesterase